MWNSATNWALLGVVGSRFYAARNQLSPFSLKRYWSVLRTKPFLMLGQFLGVSVALFTGLAMYRYHSDPLL